MLVADGTEEVVAQLVHRRGKVVAESIVRDMSLLMCLSDLRDRLKRTSDSIHFVGGSVNLRSLFHC